MSEYIPGGSNEQNNNTSGGYPFDDNRGKKKKRTGRIVAICLACLITVGAAGIGTGVFISSLNNYTVSRRAPEDKPAPPEQDNSLSLENLPSEDKTGDVLDTKIISSPGTEKVNAEYTGRVMGADEIYTMAVNACVGIRTDVTSTNIFGQITSSAISGSGFVISSDGYILTNYHVVETADEQGLDITVAFYDGSTYTAKIIGKEKENDVALIKIDAKNLPSLVLNTTGNLQVGQTVYAIGNPLGELTYSMTSGIVSALDREISVESNVSINMFQTDAAINNGNSGGPVLNDRGEVIGIASAKYSSSGVEGLGFAIPIEDAMNIVDDLIQYGYVRGKPYFGITVRTITSSVAQYYNWVEGAYIATVDENSCAADAGLRVGDIITKLNDKDILSSSDLILEKKKYSPGDSVTLTVYRGGEYIEISITLDEEGARAMLANDQQHG